MRRSIVPAALAALAAVCLAVPAGTQGFASPWGCTINGWPCWMAYPAAADDGKVLSYSATLRQAIWSAASGADAVVGNEVTDATDATLTRSGSGTAGSPYTLRLNLGNGNTWTASQTVPGIVVSGTLLNNSVLNGTFTSDTAWTKGTGWSIGSGVATVTTPGTTSTLAETASTVVAGKYYQLQWDATITASTLTPSAGGWTGAAVSATASNIQSYFYAVTTGAVTFSATSTTQGTVDNVTLKEVPVGATMTAATMTSVTAKQPVVVQKTMSAATGNEAAMQLTYQTNKATSGNDTGLLITMLDTASPGTSYGIDYQVGGASKFSVSNTGSLTATTLVGTLNGNVSSGGTSVTETIAGKSATNTGIGIQMANSTYSASSGIQQPVAITATYNQTGTASSVDLWIPRTDTATGSGTHQFISAGVGGTGSYSERFGVANTGITRITTPNGGTETIGYASEEITLSTTGLTTDSSANLLPANAIIDAVTARITTAITTTTDWAVGDPTTSTRFCSANATLALGTTAVCFNHQQGSVSTDAAGPVQTSAAKVRITCTGANPGAGKVRVCIWYRVFGAPST